jgi:hypothetical protein
MSAQSAAVTWAIQILQQHLDDVGSGHLFVESDSPAWPVCPICQEEVRPLKHGFAMTACGHAYHDICLSEALRRDSRCCLCRSPVTGVPSPPAPAPHQDPRPPRDHWQEDLRRAIEETHAMRYIGWAIHALRPDPAHRVVHLLSEAQRVERRARSTNADILEKWAVFGLEVLREDGWSEGRNDHARRWATSVRLAPLFPSRDNVVSLLQKGRRIATALGNAPVELFACFQVITPALLTDLPWSEIREIAAAIENAGFEGLE